MDSGTISHLVRLLSHRIESRNQTNLLRRCLVAQPRRGFCLRIGLRQQCWKCNFEDGQHALCGNWLQAKLSHSFQSCWAALKLIRKNRSGSRPKPRTMLEASGSLICCTFLMAGVYIYSFQMSRILTGPAAPCGLHFGRGFPMTCVVGHN